MKRLFALATFACVATTANAQVLWDAPDPFGTEEDGAVVATPGIETGGGLLPIAVADPLGDAARNLVAELYFPGGSRFLNINSGFGGGTPTFDLMPTDIGRTANISFDYYIPANTSLDNDGVDGEGNPISPDLFWTQLNYNEKNVEDNSLGFINSLTVLDNPGDWNTLNFEMLIPDMVTPRNGDPAEVPMTITPQIVFADGGFGSGTPNGSLTPAIFIDNILLEIIDTVVDENFPGDANGDGTVDLLDLDILGSNFGVTGTATFADGDFNEDTNVDLLDLDILGGNFGNSVEASAAIPEPAALALAALSALGLVARRR